MAASQETSMATDLRSLPTRVSRSASSPLASHRHQPPASDWEGQGEAPTLSPRTPLVLPFSVSAPLSSTPPSLNLVTTAAHPIWTRRDLQNTSAHPDLCHSCHWGLWLKETAETLSLLSLHIMSRIGSAFVFFNCTHRGTGSVARS